VTLKDLILREVRSEESSTAFSVNLRLDLSWKIISSQETSTSKLDRSQLAVSALAWLHVRYKVSDLGQVDVDLAWNSILHLRHSELVAALVVKLWSAVTASLVTNVVNVLLS